MKLKAKSMLLGILSISLFTVSVHADDLLPTTPQVKKATRAMMSSCKKEFSSDVSGKSIDEVDHWAEAQENAAPDVAPGFKKSQCYAMHESWEKLVQRNEWAVTNPPTNRDRMPASTGAAATTGAPTAAVPATGSGVTTH